MNPKLLHVSKHRLDKMVGATLADNLRQQYNRRSTRVVKGDSVRVMRGEYKGVEGKVEKVHTEDGTLQIEGIQHEKIRGGQVKVPIHASNVMITSLKTDDKRRMAALSAQKPAPAAATSASEAKQKAKKQESKKPKNKAKADDSSGSGKKKKKEGNEEAS